MDFSKARVLVVGDTILDRYIQGETSRLSREAPVPVLVTRTIKESAGGAANVAANVAALGAQTTLIGFIGQDAQGKHIRKLLADHAVQGELIESENASTIVKSRILCKNQQLLRLDDERGSYSDAEYASLIKCYESYISKVDVVVLSDYAIGAMREAQEFIAIACQANKPVFVDPRQRNFLCYKGATVLTPNYAEFRSIVGRCDDLDTLEKLGLQLKEDLSLQALLVTRGEDGMSLLEDAEHIHHRRAQAREVYDVTGAGDTVIAVLATAYAVGWSLVDAMRLANQAASLVVAKSGTATVDYEELKSGLHREAYTKVIYDLDDLLKKVEKARSKGMRIVMTNGCFDILHAGHIHTLRQTASLGDCLILAINDDDSVRLIKGKSRPVNNLTHRLSVLAELRMVDWIIPFSGATPQTLIEAISPDILTKGGDYKAEEVDGYQHITGYGGQVVILDYIKGLSTTGINKKLNRE